MTRHREGPTRRVNPSGAIVWLARYTTPDGSRKSAGTFKLKGPCRKQATECCAQHAIDAAYDQPTTTPDTVGEFFETWTDRHPRAERTNRTNRHRIGRVLDVAVEGRALRHWPFRDLKRRHALALVDVMFRQQKRATTGVTNILRALSAMAEDAITDEVADVNPFKGLRVRSNDIRCVKARRTAHVFSFDQMHAFAALARTVERKNYVVGATLEPTPLTVWRSVYAEPMIRTLSDCLLRLGELLALHRLDLCMGCFECEGAHFHVSRNAHEGVILEGDTSTKRHQKIVPVPPTTLAMVQSVPPRIDTPLMWPTPKGRVWRESLFGRDVWRPTRQLEQAEAIGMGVARPGDFRHSGVTHLRAALGENHSTDLAAIAGHDVATMTANYSHSLGATFDKVRAVIG